MDEKEQVRVKCNLQSRIHLASGKGDQFLNLFRDSFGFQVDQDNGGMEAARKLALFDSSRGLFIRERDQDRMICVGVMVPAYMPGTKEVVKELGLPHFPDKMDMDRGQIYFLLPAFTNRFLEDLHLVGDFGCTPYVENYEEFINVLKQIKKEALGIIVPGSECKETKYFCDKLKEISKEPVKVEETGFYLFLDLS